jgi:4-amino-4-deoxy-L-arabinose transferase-like glycosyltransferase
MFGQANGDHEAPPLRIPKDFGRPAHGGPGFLLTVGLVAGVALSLAVARNLFPLGIPGQWVWAYSPLAALQHPLAWADAPFIHAALLSRPLPVVVALIVLVLIALRVWDHSRRALKLVLLAGLALGSWWLSIQVCVVDVYRYSFLTFTVLSPATNAYFSVATEVEDPREFGQTFPQRMSHLPIHASTQSPGPILAFYGLNRALDHAPGLLQTVPDRLLAANETTPETLATGSLAYFRTRGWPVPTPDHVRQALIAALLLPLLGSLSVVPIYLLGSRLRSPRAGLMAAALFAVSPCFLLFTSTVDQVYPLFSAGVAVCLLLAVRSASGARGTVWAAAGGLVYGVGVFLNLGLLALAPLLLIFGLLAFYRSAPNRRPMKLIGMVLAFLLGVAAILLLTWALWRVNLFAVFAESNRLRNELYATGFPRERWAWASWNVLDFLIFLGPPVALLLLRGLGAELRRPRTASIAVALAVTIALITLSGKQRGEAARMWIFLAPFATTVAAIALADLSASRRRVFVWILAVMILQTLVFKEYLEVMAGAAPYTRWPLAQSFRSLDSLPATSPIVPDRCVAHLPPE